MKKRADKMYEKKIWIPLPEGTFIENPDSPNIRYDKQKNIFEKRTSFYNKDKRLLGLEINEIQNQINKGTYVLDNDSTFEQVSEKWFKAHVKGKPETTQESYSIYQNHANKLIGKKKIQEFKPMDIEEAYNVFLNEVDKTGKKKHNKNSAKHLHAIVNMVFKFAVANKILYCNPCDSIKKENYKPDKFQSYVYSEKEFKKLLDMIKDTDVEIIVVLAGGVGLRAGEICGLKWDDIDFDKKMININRVRYRIKGEVGEKIPKTEKSLRSISVDDYILETLKRHKNDCCYVLCRSTKKPYRNDEIYHMFIDALDYYGMPKTRLHDLRHYNATMMAYYGVDVKTAAARLGHSNVSTTLEIYQHVLNEMDRSAAEKLGKMFKAEKTQNKGNKNKTLEIYEHMNNLSQSDLEKLVKIAMEKLSNSPVVKTVVNNEKEKDFSTTVIAENPSLN